MRHETRRTLRNEAVGGVAGAALGFVPVVLLVAPLLGGGIAGYLRTPGDALTEHPCEPREAVHRFHEDCSAIATGDAVTSRGDAASRPDQPFGVWTPSPGPPGER